MKTRKKTSAVSPADYSGGHGISDDQEEADVLRILERSPYDESVHAEIIERPYLSDAILTRLVAIVSDSQLETLFARHPLPMQSRREVLKRLPTRPAWWRHKLFAVGD